MQQTEANNLIIRSIQVGFIRTNCYIITNKDSNEALIIDPGEEHKRIIEYIEELKVKPIAILLTHGHFDHIRAVNEIAENYHIKVYAGKDELEIINDVELNCSKTFRRDYIAKVDETFTDGQEVCISDFRFKVLFTPGHTLGSICFYFEQEKVLFSGDTIFNLGVGRTDFPTGSARTLLESINKKLRPLDDDIIVFPGHGEPTTIGYERRNSECWLEGEQYV
ncbi:MAG: MBL fold metallo-hydrolase [Lachnospiraceae bacterium]|nr:MBL fold metallo-hydrolase [Lachnospiraceae bacterium]